MDPNTMKPSPPPSIYSPPSLESLRSASAQSSTSPKSPRTTPPPTIKSVTMLPFAVQLAIFKFVADALEGIFFEIFEEKGSTLLEEKEIECKEQLELNWGCRHLPQYAPNIDRESLNDWIPDIRHHAVHRNKMTATAACRTISEAGKLASSLGHHTTGHHLHYLASEMDQVRRQMKEAGALTDKDLPVEIKKGLLGRLTTALTTAAAGAAPLHHQHHELSPEVTAYTFEDKIRENPWTDMSHWNQDRQRNYLGSRSSSLSWSLPSSRANQKQVSRKASEEDLFASPRKASTYLPPALRSQQSWRKLR
ncbi:MAG: hypothetical protein Q9218_002946 [Villophora microphyllina]